MQELQKKLWELTEESTRIINTHPEYFKFYWRHGDYKFKNPNLANWYEQETGHFCEYHHVKIDDIRLALEDKSLDMDYNYNLDFLKHIRNKYDHVTFLMSGGWDSHTVFMEAMDNNIYIDLLHSWIWLDKYHPCNIEQINNVYPLLDLFRGKYGTYTQLVTSWEIAEQYWEDEWTIFTCSSPHPMPQHMCMQVKPGYDSAKILGLTDEQMGNILPTQNSVAIKFSDKPQMIYYDNRWYVTAQDGHDGSSCDINNLHFWFEPENVKSLVKDARTYRDYILSTHKGRLGKLEFFKLTNPGNEINQYINRRPIIDSNAQYPKMEKQWPRWKDAYDSNWTLMNNYFRNINNFLKVFPGSDRDNFKKYNQNRKWAWCIDIDTLEIYTQTELIPDGFDL